MNKKLLHTPEGVRDIYNGECQRKQVIQKKLHAILKKYGYQDIETPTFEYFDIFNSEKGTLPSREMYKFFDRNNNTLVLRPDMTPSIARSVAKYYDTEKYPIRLSYVGNTFTNGVSYQLKLKEVTQIGGEFVNDDSAAADAEIISMIVESFLHVGLTEFKIAIGQVEFFKGLVEEAGFDKDEEEELREIIENKNTFSLEQWLRKKQLKEEVEVALKSITGLYGDVELLDKVKEVTNNERALKAVERLKQVHKILEIYGYDKYVNYDLGMLSHYHYYTGIIFKGYTYGTGDAIAKGGRYDDLMGQFGKKAPAIGFVITIDELLLALSRQKININIKKRDYIFVYEEGTEKEVISLAMCGRKMGKRIALIEGTKEADLDGICAYASEQGFKKIVFCSKKNGFEIYTDHTFEKMTEEQMRKEME